VMGRWHVHALRRLGLSVSGVVDADPSRAARLAGRAPGCAPYASVAEALTARPFKAAHVCTPLETHVDVVGELLAAGVHVLVEKPTASTARETDQLISLAAERDLVLCPVHQFLFQHGVLKALEGLRGSGPILHIDMVAASAGAVGQSPEAADEVVADILPHPLYLMRRIVGGGFASARWQRPVVFPGEFRAAGICGRTSLGILISMGGRPTRNTLRIMCMDGTFHVDLFHGFALRERAGVSRARKALRPFTVSLGAIGAAGTNLVHRVLRREPAYPGLRELILRFHRAIAGGPLPITPSEMLDVARARDDLLVTS